MKLTAGQLRECVGLTKETFRHWRAVVPFLALGNSRSARFSPQHLLATATLYEISNQTGIGVGSLKNISEKVFSVCAKNPWTTLENAYLILDVHSNSCEIGMSSDLPLSDRIMIVCPLKTIIRNLHKSLSLGHVLGYQGYLPLHTDDPFNLNELEGKA